MVVVTGSPSVRRALLELNSKTLYALINTCDSHTQTHTHTEFPVVEFFNVVIIFSLWPRVLEMTGKAFYFFPKALRRVLPENPLNTDTSTRTLRH